MPWSETSVMEQRLEFVYACQRRSEPFAATCRRFGISRKNGYKWLRRYDADGQRGLVDASRARKTMEHRTPQHVAELLVDLKRRKPRWGPKKLVRMLADAHPGLEIPSPSTAGAILDAHGLVAKVKRRADGRPARRLNGGEFRPVAGPNCTWAADFKGQYRLADGTLCYPATITDTFSRSLIACQAVSTTRTGPTRVVWENAFREYGLPNTLRTDNGPPFRGGAGRIGLSELSVWLIELGINPEFIDPGQPQQNGRHERFHRTLGEEAVDERVRNLDEQQLAFDAFRREYNDERPHESLGMKTPSSVHQPSARKLPEELPEPRYAAHLLVRRTRFTGEILWRGESYAIARALQNKSLGIERLCDGLVRVQFFNKVLGLIDEETKTFIGNPEWHLPTTET